MPLTIIPGLIGNDKKRLDKLLSTSSNGKAISRIGNSLLMLKSFESKSWQPL